MSVRRQTINSIHEMIESARQVMEIYKQGMEDLKEIPETADDDTYLLLMLKLGADVTALQLQQEDEIMEKTREIL